MSTAWIDADVLKYVAGFACQKTVWTHIPTGEWFEGKEAANEWFKATYKAPEKGIRDWMQKHWKDDEWETELKVEPWSNCQFIIESKIGEILSATGVEDFVMCLSPTKCFRNRLAVTRGYKANRKDSPKPHYAPMIVDYLRDSYTCITGDDIEADDVMGMSMRPGDVIATNDKDLQMIPGKHYDFTKGELFIVPPFEADRWFFVQLIAGDSTDNIQGIPGLGVAKAEKIVDSFDGDTMGLVEEINDLYCLHYDMLPVDWKEVRDEHAGLVWILRKGETPETAGWREFFYCATT